MPCDFKTRGVTLCPNRSLRILPCEFVTEPPGAARVKPKAADAEDKLSARGAGRKNNAKFGK